MARKQKPRYADVGGLKIRAGKTHAQVARQLSRIDTAAYYGDPRANALMSRVAAGDGKGTRLGADYQSNPNNRDPWGRRWVEYRAADPAARYQAPKAAPKPRKSIGDVFEQRERLAGALDADLDAGRIGFEEYRSRLRRVNEAAYSMTDRMNAAGYRRFGGAANNPDYKYSYSARMGISNG